MEAVNGGGGVESRENKNKLSKQDKVTFGVGFLGLATGIAALGMAVSGNQEIALAAAKFSGIAYAGILTSLGVGVWGMFRGRN